jgi:uncharacterized protein (TIGR01777 family)
MIAPWERGIMFEHGGVHNGRRVVIEAGSTPFRRRQAMVFRDVEAGSAFTSVALQGPLAPWRHTVRVLPRGAGLSELIDHVEYGPAGPVGAVLGGAGAPRQLERLFRFRQSRILSDMTAHAKWADRPRMKVAIAGASGLIGSHLNSFLRSAGHEVVRLVRRPARAPGEVGWDPDVGLLDPDGLRGVTAVVCLCGASLASVWTAARRDELVQSRLRSTRTLVAAMRQMDVPPAVFVSASAVGVYGSRGGEALTEESSLGTGFLAELCQRWEDAAVAASACGVRVVTPRFGLVVSGAGGVLPAAMRVFRAGLGGRFGDGWQWWSWVSMDDALGALEWALHDPDVRGAVNVVAPGAVTNREFTKTLAKALHRPAALEVPEAVAFLLGGVSREMLLASQRAAPMRLHEAGFHFLHSSLEGAVRFELGR